jgi:hypothetical protein
MIENWRQKWSKFIHFWGGQKSTKKMLKKSIFEGGSRGPKMIKIDGGVRGGPIYKFFEILQFSTKAPPLFDPKIDPQKGPYKNVIPHK